MNRFTEKIPLVMLHGWGLNFRIWQPLLSRLTNSFDVTLLSLPGYGDDLDYLGDYSMSAVVDRLMAAAPAQAIWVGWSLGATVAMQAALSHPQRFLKLQLVAATPRFMLGDDWEFGMQAEPLDQLAELFFTSYEKGLKKFLLLQTDDRMLIRQQLESARNHSQPSLTTLKNSLDLLKQTDLRGSIHEIAVETQVIAGKEDRLVSPISSRRLAEIIGDAEFILLDDWPAGHLCFLEASDRFINQLVTFSRAAAG